MLMLHCSTKRKKKLYDLKVIPLKCVVNLNKDCL